MPPPLPEITFLLGPPGSGGPVLAAALARASGVFHAPASADVLIGAPPEGSTDAVHGRSHALEASEAAGRERAVRDVLAEALRDREGCPLPRDGEPVAAVVWSARSALRVPFLDAVFPGCRFVLCLRDPTSATEEMLRSWQSGRFVTEPQPPDWPGPPWSLPLIPGWQGLAGRPLEQIVVEQWTVIAEHALDALERIAAQRWAIAEFQALMDDPTGELRRVCDFTGIGYDQALLAPVEETARRLAGNRPHAPEALKAQLGRTVGVQARIQELRPTRPATRSGRRARDGGSPFRSSFTAAFPKLLGELRSSLLISTYQSGRLICARANGAMLNTHLRDFDKPMGIAATRDRFALGTRTELWDFRDMPAAAPKVAPAGTHDACFIPRNRHVTGDILIHELAYDAEGELWGVATAFSCLVTFDCDSSFVPRWMPSFITELKPGDRCHLNGLCVRDGRVSYLTALGQSDSPGGWRAGKADGGVLIDISSSELVAGGLSMPHSPRWHDDRLWVLESGRGELVQVDLDSGTTETVAELPGFTRGLAMVGHHAFVGLSQIRESSTFGDLPIVERLEERLCGVWVVDLRSGEITATLRFDDLVQEIFDVALLRGVGYPEIAEPGSSAVATSFVLG